MSLSRKLTDIQVRLARAEQSRNEWQRRAQIAESEVKALEAMLPPDQKRAWNVRGAEGSAPAREEVYAPAWISTFLTSLGILTIVVMVVGFCFLQLWWSLDAWFLLSILVMAGLSMMAIGHRMRNPGTPAA